MKRKLFNRISLSTMVILGVIPALGAVQTVCARGDNLKKRRL